MKINNKNTALGLIDYPKTFDFGFPDPHITPKFSPKELRDFGNSLLESSPHLKEMCGNNIQYVSHSFMEAFSKAFPKLKDLFYEEEINDGGVLITGGTSNGYTHYHTYYYAVVSVPGSDGKKVGAYNIVFMDFSKHAKADSTVLDVYVSTKTNIEDDSVITSSMIWDGYMEDKLDSAYWQMFIIGFLLFKKYCDIETKVIDPKKNRRATVAGQKYLNETDKRITILDATWFTNLVVSGAFGVRGHLRWQPYGPGLQQKKLIWVEEFTKEGYTRKAKAIQQNGTT